MRHHFLDSGAIQLTFAACICFLCLGGNVSGQTNRWSASGDGFWDDPLNWSLTLSPSTNQLLVSIESPGSKTVTIDRFTAGNNAGTLTVSNLLISAPSGSTNTLFLNNAGTNKPLTALGAFTVGTNGALTVLNSAVNVKNGDLNVEGQLTENSGDISVARGTVAVGTLSPGAYQLNGGSLLASNLFIGITNYGMMEQSGGTNQVTAALRLGTSPGGSGFYKLGGGVLISAVSSVGDSGVGSFIQTGGSNYSSSLSVGSLRSSVGTYTLNDGFLTTTTTALGSLGLGDFFQSGGVHRVARLSVGGFPYPGRAKYYLTNGLIAAGSISIGAADFVQFGGTNTVSGG